MAGDSARTARTFADILNGEKCWQASRAYCNWRRRLVGYRRWHRNQFTGNSKETSLAQPSCQRTSRHRAPASRDDPDEAVQPSESGRSLHCETKGNRHKAKNIPCFEQGLTNRIDLYWILQPVKCLHHASRLSSRTRHMNMRPLLLTGEEKIPIPPPLENHGAHK